MSTSTTWPGGAANPTPTSYSVPAAGEVNWANLSNFLNALAGGAQGTTFQKFANRIATTSPVTISTNDCIVICALTVPGTVAVSLPAGAAKQVFFIVDGTGDAKTNNITITPNGAETINGAATFVLNTNYQGVCISFNSGTSNWNVLLNNNSVGTNIGGFTASRAIVSDSGGFLAAATTTSTEIGYVNGVTSAIQTQINTKTTNPMTTTGDVIYASNTASPATPARLGVGTTSYALLSTGTLPAWGQIVNASVDNAAAIAYSKLNLTGGIVNADVNASAAIAVSKLAALTVSRAVVTNASGFVSAATTTATEIGYVNGVTSAIQTQLDAKGTNPLTTTGDIIYASNTATPATQARLGIGASSTVLNVSGGIPAWTLIANANIGSGAAIAFSKLATLTSGNILVGSSGNVATSVAMSGDATIIDSGALTIANSAITNVKVSASAAIAFSKLATLSSGNILVGSAGNVATSVAVTGDVTISNAGVTAIASGVIVNAQVNASAAIAGTKISPDFGSQNVVTTGSVSGISIVPGTGDGTATVGGGTIRGPDRTGANAIPQDLSIKAPNGTGTAGSGGILFYTAPAAASSSTANVLQINGALNNAGKWTLGVSGGTQAHATNGSMSFSTGIVGRTSGTSYAAGVVGESITQSRVSSNLNLTSSTFADGTTSPIALTAGTWLITVGARFNRDAGITQTDAFLFVGTATGNATTGLLASQNSVEWYGSATGANNIISLMTGPYYVNLSGSQSYYCKVFAVFTGVGNCFVTDAWIQGVRVGS